MKKFLLILFLLTAPLTACSTFNEINEKAKGDGVPYIPGIQNITNISNFN